MKVGDLVQYNRQPDYCFGSEEYGVGVIISHIDIDELLQPVRYSPPPGEYAAE